MKIEALKQVINSGGNNYPLYIAFIKASEILKISSVPNFSSKDKEEAIAKNIKNKPVEKWQRPLIPVKREAITNTFNNTGEFMPNPVLLSENPYKDEIIIAKPKTISGQISSLWEIEITDNNQQLWIIDGQHRINGLGHDDCAQNQNVIPVVILLNTDSDYSPTDFAKIFAQVTTKATPLSPLHKEWLEYSFDMDKYSHANRQKAMKTVIDLCSNPNFIDRTGNFPNPFYDKIIFNDENRRDNELLNCQVFSSLIFDYYYSLPASFFHLTPEDLSLQIQKAYFQLKKVVNNPNDSVFFGNTQSKKHVIMIKSIIKGFLAYLLRHCDPSKGSHPDLNNWNDLFVLLNIHGTDWNWSIHTQSGTSWEKNSEKLASTVLIEAFINMSIPDGCTDLTECICLGNNSFIELRLTDSNGNQIPRNINSARTILNYPGQVSNIMIIDKSFNSEILSVVDQKTTALYPEYFKMDYARSYKIGKGIDLPLTRAATKARPLVYNSTNRFTLQMKTTLYGGRTDVKEIEFII